MLPDLAGLIRFLPGLVLGVTVHEFAHAYTATKLGDTLALRQGRVSLNPLRHLDPIGTLALIFVHFGWGKPVPVNTHNFRNPRRDFLLTSLAGPASNVALAALILPLLYVLRHTLMFGLGGEARMDLVFDIARNAFALNLVLAVFNLLPVPPLDGSRILPYLVPSITPEIEQKLSFIGVAALIFLMWTGRLSAVFGVVVGPAMKLVPPTDREAFHRYTSRGIGAMYDHDDEALAAFGAALRLDPEAEEVLFWRGHVLGRQGKWTAALSDLDRAVALAGPKPEYLEYRAWLREKLGMAKEAEADYDQAEGIRVRSRPKLLTEQREAFLEHFQAGKSACLEGKYAEAVASLGEALWIDPDSESALYWRARALGGQKKWTKAQADIDRAIELNPGNRRYSRLLDELDHAMAGGIKTHADETRASFVQGQPTGVAGCPARRDEADVNEAISVALPKVHLTGVPLAPALQFFQDVSEVPIEVDWDALKRAGVAPTTPVKVDTAGQTVRENLRLALQYVSSGSRPITYAVVGGKILIPATPDPQTSRVPLTDP